MPKMCSKQWSKSSFQFGRQCVQHQLDIYGLSKSFQLTSTCCETSQIIILKWWTGIFQRRVISWAAAAQNIVLSVVGLRWIRIANPPPPLFGPSDILTHAILSSQGLCIHYKLQNWYPICNCGLHLMHINTSKNVLLLPVWKYFSSESLKWT